eukprot:GHVQ01010899.1.p1 GENE.GHVQ01010899.1~~GHVQ01010899.1.p1  ORF type:complete len:587 (-),score=78.60 GHVQ01010899.1:161-1921(-)
MTDIPKHISLSSTYTMQDDGNSPPSHCVAVVPQNYGFLFVVDCEVAGQCTLPPSKSEIIRFSYDIYDVENGGVAFRSANYIRPEFAEVADEQLQQMNVSRHELMEAGTLSEAVQQFDSHMFAKCQEARKPTVIVTYGKYSFRDYFRNDARKKNITLFHHYNHFIDLVPIIRDKDPLITGDDLRTAYSVMKRLDLPEKHENGSMGREDNCANITALVRHLMSEGVLFGKEHVVVIPDEYEPPEYAPSLDIIHIVRVRGLPWDVTEQELIDFFRPVCHIRSTDVKIVLGYDGRTNGEAYVLMGCMEHRDSAIRELHGKHIGKRWIEVFKATEEEYNKYMTNKRAITGGCTAVNESVLRLRGLPWSANECEITRFFKEEGDYSIGVDQVVMGYGQDNRLSGEAWVTMESPEKAEEARKTLNRKLMGKRYIEVFASSQQDVEAAKSYKTGQPSAAGPQSYGYGGGPSGGAQPQYGFSVIRMRGLPFHANEQHIVNFFNGYHMAAILPSTAPVNGRPSGEAYVQFMNAAEAWRAYNDKQGAPMDRRYIELFAATQREMDFAAAGADPRSTYSSAMPYERKWGGGDPIEQRY